MSMDEEVSLPVPRARFIPCHGRVAPFDLLNQDQWIDCVELGRSSAKRTIMIAEQGRVSHVCILGEPDDH